MPKGFKRIEGVYDEILHRTKLLFKLLKSLAFVTILFYISLKRTEQPFLIFQGRSCATTKERGKQRS